MWNKISSLKNMIFRELQKEIFFGKLNSKFPSSHFDRTIVIKGPLSNLILGENVIIQDFSVLHLGGMEWCNHAGQIKIGDNSVISPHCTLYGAGSSGIEIGNNFSSGIGVVIVSSTEIKLGNRNSHVFKPVSIGDNVTIFSNCVISAGVTIGNNSQVAAGSVILSDIPENVFVAGSPGKIIKEIIPE